MMTTADVLADAAIVRALIESGAIVSTGYPHDFIRNGCDGMMVCGCPPPTWRLSPEVLAIVGTPPT